MRVMLNQTIFLFRRPPQPQAFTAELAFRESWKCVMTACPLCTHTNDNRQESSAVSASVPKKNVAHNTKSISFVVRTVGSSPAGKPKVRYNYQTLIYFQLVDHLFC